MADVAGAQRRVLRRRDEKAALVELRLGDDLFKAVDRAPRDSGLLKRLRPMAARLSCQHGCDIGAKFGGASDPLRAHQIAMLRQIEQTTQRAPEPILMRDREAEPLAVAAGK